MRGFAPAGVPTGVYAPANAVGSGTYYAKTYAGATADAQSQAALDACVADGGGTVVIPTGTLDWTTAPLQVPANFTGHIHIRGVKNRTTKVRLSNACPRFADFVKVAAGDTYQNLTISDLTVDAGLVTTLSNSAHGIIGCMRNGLGSPNGYQVNVDRVRVERVVGLNGPQIGTTGQMFAWIGFFVAEDMGGTERSITRCSVYDVELFGADTGIAFAGVRRTSNVGDYAPVYVDDILVEQWRHEMPNVPVAFASYNSLYVCGRGYGRKVTVRDGYSKNCTDAAVEIDAMTDAFVERVTVDDAWSNAFYHTNLAPPLANQQIVWSACKARRFNLTADSTHGFGWVAIGDATHGVANNLVARDCSWHRKTIELALSGEAFQWTAASGTINLDNFRAVVEGINTTDATGYASSPVKVKGSSTVVSAPTRVKIRNLYASLAGIKGGGAGNVNWYTLDFDGASSSSRYVLDITGVETDYNVTAGQAAGMRGPRLNNGTFSGRIAAVRPGIVTGDTAPRGMTFAGAANVSVDGRLMIEDPDFRAFNAIGGAVNIVWSPGGVAIAGVKITGAAWTGTNGFPLQPFALTPGVSPWAYANTDGVVERVIVAGGTVSAIEISQAAGSYINTGVTAGSFELDSDDNLRVTYTVAPTVTKLGIR